MVKEKEYRNYKKISLSYYSHRDSSFWRGKKLLYLNNIKMTYPDLYKRLFNICEVIRFDDTHTNKKIVLMEFFDFDKELNPVIKAWYTFEANGVGEWIYKGRRENSKKNPFILHKKELMVDDSYNGFSQKLSKDWTEFYSNSGLNEFKETTRIGRKLFWDKCLEQLKTKYKSFYVDFINEWNNQWK